MIKTLNVEPIKYREKYLSTPLLTKAEVEKAMDYVVAQTRANMEYFGTRFPWSATKGLKYPIIDCIEWTDGFWTGLLWLCYEYTGDEEFRILAEKNIDSFLYRVENRIELDHHDLGFLYSISAVAGYKLTGSEKAKRAGILAADKLMERYNTRDKFIQAWGAVGAKDNYRLIIDCFMNIPLLYWATQITGDTKYAEAADNHYEKAANHVIRDDASAFHTFYFDYETGAPVRGATRQGYSDDSAWARGQTWGIYGIPLNYIQNHNPASINLFEGMANYFLNRLPEDDVPYWDLIFSDGSGHSRDSSSGAIAVCGMLEMGKYLPELHPEKETYKYACHRILRSLINNYQGDKVEPGNPILYHGVYSWHSGKGVDEGNIWGDFYYMEALMRMWKDWNLYW